MAAIDANISPLNYQKRFRAAILMSGQDVHTPDLVVMTEPRFGTSVTRYSLYNSFNNWKSGAQPAPMFEVPMGWFYLQTGNLFADPRSSEARNRSLAKLNQRGTIDIKYQIKPGTPTIVLGAAAGGSKANAKFAAYTYYGPSWTTFNDYNSYMLIMRHIPKPTYGYIDDTNANSGNVGVGGTMAIGTPFTELSVDKIIDKGTATGNNWSYTKSASYDVSECGNGLLIGAEWGRVAAATNILFSITIEITINIASTGFIAGDKFLQGGFKLFRHRNKMTYAAEPFGEPPYAATGNPIGGVANFPMTADDALSTFLDDNTTSVTGQNYWKNGHPAVEVPPVIEQYMPDGYYETPSPFASSTGGARSLHRSMGWEWNDQIKDAYDHFFDQMMYFVP